MKHLTRLSLTGLVFVAQLATGGAGKTIPAARPTLADAFPVAEAQFATQRPVRLVGAPA